MRQKLIITTAIVFFLLVNTSYFWQRALGIMAIPVFIIGVLCFLILVFILITETWRAAKEGFVNKQRRWLVFTVAAALGLTFLFPTGLIDYEIFESKVVLQAYHEGAGNCGLTLKLREDGTYALIEVCFGMTETEGRYRVSGDSIFLESEPDSTHKYRTALIEQGSATSDNNYLVLFGDDGKEGLSMKIVKKEL